MLRKDHINQHNKKIHRIYLYTKDVMRITGKHEQTARKMLRIVREAFGKSPKAPVTVYEYSVVYETDEDILLQFVE